MPTTAAALLRVAVDSSTPMPTRQQRDQVDGVGGEHQQQRFGRGDDGPEKVVTE